MPAAAIRSGDHPCADDPADGACGCLAHFAGRVAAVGSAERGIGSVQEQRALWIDVGTRRDSKGVRPWPDDQCGHRNFNSRRIRHEDGHPGVSGKHGNLFQSDHPGRIGTRRPRRRSPETVVPRFRSYVLFYQPSNGRLVLHGIPERIAYPRTDGGGP